MDQDKRIKLFLFGGFVALLVAIVSYGVHSLIHNFETRNEHGEEAPAHVEASAAQPAAAADKTASSKPEGEVLMEKNDCVTCHKIDTKLVGPAYKDVAAKYKGADEAKIDELVQKVKKGGAGNWGQVPMTPHPQVSEKDIRTIVKWVLTLK